MTPQLWSAPPADGTGDWQQQLALIVATMREMSQQTDPQAMVRAYAAKIRQMLPTDMTVSLSRRLLERPRYRITRCSLWKEEVNPWKDKERLPVLEGGLLGELIYGDEPRIIEDLQLAPDDPAADYFIGQRSLMAIPHYDQGVALNMVIHTRKEPAAFDRHRLPEWVWLSNLFGRATHNLVLAEELKRAYESVDYELKIVADIQRSLLPSQLPRIPTLDLAVSYQTSLRAGGDYYDFFQLPEDKWGILIADVSGHGTPAAVLMAITHSIAHGYPGPPTPPGRMLTYVNRQLAGRYTAGFGKFVTAFYGIYDPAKRLLTYACAGHNPPRLKRCSNRSLDSLDGVRSLPLGVREDETYEEHTQPLVPGDQVVFYTDGITDATSPAGEMFGLARLDKVLEECTRPASEMLAEVLRAVDRFAAGRPAADDRTILVAKVS
jgi:sigma-B regulation protein RsbU (phosphoserine phosphatase)